MLFSVTKIAIGAAALFGLVQAQDDNCGNGPWNPGNINVVGGGSRGTRFCASKHPDGIIVTGVEVWSSSSYVERVQFTYSDKSVSPWFGKELGGDRHQKIDWDPATVTVNQLNLWGNGNARWLGRVQLGLSDGRMLDVGKDTSGQNMYSSNVESGIISGVYGGQEEGITYIGFLFLKSKIRRIEMTDLMFDDNPEDLNARQQGIEVVTLDEIEHTNGRSEDETFDWKKEVRNEESRTLSTTFTNTFGASIGITVKASILALESEISAQLSYSYTDSREISLTSSNSVALTWGTSTIVKPGQTVYCRAAAQKGKYSGPLNSKVHVILEDNSEYTFQSRAMYSMVSWSKARSKCQDTQFNSTSFQQMDAPKKPMRFFA